jgi:predicted regulator of Ras-like GTPase activity (Roadblock/LC7/MglB family)
MITPFKPILQRVVERVPGALGAIFADWEGEAVDSFAPGFAKDDMLILAAHYGVLLHHVQSVLHLTHYGEAHELILHHVKLDLIIITIDKHYFLVLATEAGSHLATALREVAAAALALRAEI